MKKIILNMFIVIILLSGCQNNVVEQKPTPTGNDAFITQEVSTTAQDSSERIGIISNIIFSGFPFSLDEPWEREFKLQFEKTIDPDEYYKSNTELITDTFLSKIADTRHTLITKYIEVITNESYTNIEQSFWGLLNKYELTKDTEFFYLICEFLSTTDYDCITGFHEMRIKYYKEYYDKYWNGSLYGNSMETQYQQYGGSILTSMYLSDYDAEERIKYMYEIVNKCPYYSEIVPFLLSQTDYITKDYENEKLLEGDVYNYIDKLSNEVEELSLYINNNDKAKYITSIYLLSIKYEYTATIDKYYSYMCDLYGEEAVKKMEQY
jgi:hypothetical protein